MTTGVRATRAFSIDLPNGMVSIPVVAISGGARALAVELAGLLGLPAEDPSAAAVADVFTAFGAMVGDAGMDFAATGLFRSPDDPDRPVSVFLLGTRMPSDHDSPDVAVAGLRDLHGEQGGRTVETVTLPAGSAAIVVDEDAHALAVGQGMESTIILTRRATAWIPDPRGTTVAVVSVLSPSWQDWARTCDLALDVFDSFTWE